MLFNFLAIYSVLPMIRESLLYNGTEPHAKQEVSIKPKEAFETSTERPKKIEKKRKIDYENKIMESGHEPQEVSASKIQHLPQV